MDLKKFLLSNQFPYCVLPRRKVVSGFCLGVGASLVVLSLVLINLSIKASLLSPMCRGFNSYCLFSYTTNATSNVEELQKYGDLTQTVGEGKVLYKTHQGNNSVSSEDDGNSLGSNGEGPSLEDTHVGIFSVNVKNGSFTPEEGRLGQNTESVNGSDTGSKNANFTYFNGEGEVRERAHIGNSSGKVKNGSFSHGDVIAVKGIIEENVAARHANESSLSTPVGFFTVNSNNKVTENNNAGNLSNNRDNVGSPGEKVQPSEINNQRILSREKNSTVSYEDSQAMERENDSYGKCDLFDGRWVRDDSKPYYPSGSCPYIDRDVNCHLNKRPDDGFLKWKWQPNGCDIPNLNATDFLEKLRGKKLVFVGDSLNRNMWESLVCILRHSIRNKKRVYETSGRTEFKKKGFYAFRFEDYNCSVDFVAAPFLVRESSFNGRNGSLETLRLDLMDRTTSMYYDAHVIVFNTGHWWAHEKTSKGEDYYQEGNHVYQKLEVLEAYKKALTTWARWVDKNIDARRTQVIFRGYSVTHFSGGQWNSGGQCHKETEPILNETHLANYPSKMRALEQVIQQMRTPVIYLNISRLTDYRKDGHPSIYRRKYATLEEQIAAEQSQDCSHWCLPGVPDSWNELLYASLLQAGKGSWRS